MSDVKRNWIHTSSPGEEDDFLFVAEPAPERWLKKLIGTESGLPWPVLALGFFAVAFFSFSMTYFFTGLFPGTLELAPNPNIPRFEAALAESEPVAPAHYTPAAKAKAPGYPAARLAPKEAPGVKKFAHLSERVGEPLQPAVYRASAAAQARHPVAELTFAAYLDQDLMSRELSLRHDATPKSMKPRARTFARAAGLADPVAIIDPAPKTVRVVSRQDALPEKLFKRRHAFAAAMPVSEETPPAESAEFSQAVVGEEPDAILTLEEARPAPAEKPAVRRYAKLGDAPRVQEQQVITPAAPRPSVVVREKDETKAWRKYAAQVPAGAENKPKIVIIIDDMGNNRRMSELMGSLEGPLNFAFLPYAPGVESQTKKIRAQGHELLVHMPMEPTGSEYPGPNALKTGLSEQDLKANLDWNLSRFEGFVGINNHMGSRFTKDQAGMAVVMETLKDRGLLFLDSVTTGGSKGPGLAIRMGLPWAGRDVFLDNEIDEAAIHAQLLKVERIAKRKGLAVAIGHPHAATYRALKAWIASLDDKGFALVPVSSIVEYKGERKLAVGASADIASD